MDEFERVAIAADFLFVAVAQLTLTEDDCADARLLGRHAFNAIRRHGALDESMFPQHLERLCGLSGAEFLTSVKPLHVGQSL